MAMSEVQEIVALIAGAAEYVDDKPFMSALIKLNEYLNTIPEELHKYTLQKMWRKDEKGA